MTTSCSFKAHEKYRNIHIYMSFIVPHFDYCAQTWFYCNKISAKKLEKENERAVRFFLETNTLHIKNLLKLLGRRTLFLEVSGAQDLERLAVVRASSDFKTLVV